MCYLGPWLATASCPILPGATAALSVDLAQLGRERVADRCPNGGRLRVVWMGVRATWPIPRFCMSGDNVGHEWNPTVGN